MQQRSACPVSPLNGEAYPQRKSKRRQRSIGKYLAELRRENGSETHGITLRAIQLVNRAGRGHGNQRPYAETYYPDQPWALAPRSCGLTILRARDSSAPARPQHELSGAMRTPALRFGGAAGAKRAFVRTYEGLPVGSEPHTALGATGFHLKLHAPAICTSFDRRSSFVFVPLSTPTLQQHSITLTPFGGPYFVPDNQLLEPEISTFDPACSHPEQICQA